MLEKNYMSNECSKLKVYKTKSKEGICERANNDSEVICRNMFKKETNLAVFNGLKVTLSSGDEGTIDGSFGQSGKFKVRIPSKLLLLTG